MRARVFRLFLVPVFVASFIATGLTLTADVGEAQAVSCKNFSEKFRWEFWNQAGGFLWADHNVNVRGVCWTSYTTYCGTTSYTRLDGNAWADSASWGCVKNSNGSTRHWVSHRVKTMCTVPPYATMYGYVTMSVTVWPGGYHYPDTPSVTGNACYWGYADHYR